jgi:hypothetical protein
MEATEGLTWKKSRASSAQNGCVEVGTALDGRAYGIRDSERPNDGHLTVTPTMLGALLADIKAGALDLLGAQAGGQGQVTAWPLCHAWGFVTLGCDHA